MSIINGVALGEDATMEFIEVYIDELIEGLDREFANEVLIKMMEFNPVENTNEEAWGLLNKLCAMVRKRINE